MPRPLVALGIGLLLLPTGTGPSRGDASADAPPTTGQAATHHVHAMGDEHAAHRAALEKPQYAVTAHRYPVPDVELIDATGRTVALRGLLEQDQPVALNFIFTTCTTICPVMTATFAQMQRELGSAAGEVQLVSISIDPEYDRPEVLHEYAERFKAGAGWTFLTGDGADISRVLLSFEAYAGSKMNHQPITLLKSPRDSSWIRIDGLASGQDLAREVTARLLN
jgi:protein SCO1/2